MSLVIPTVQFSRTENRFVKRGMSFTADEPKNPSHFLSLEIALFHCVRPPGHPRQLLLTQISCLQYLPGLSWYEHVPCEVQGNEEQCVPAYDSCSMSEFQHVGSSSQCPWVWISKRC